MVCARNDLLFPPARVVFARWSSAVLGFFSIGRPCPDQARRRSQAFQVAAALPAHRGRLCHRRAISPSRSSPTGREPGQAFRHFFSETRVRKMPMNGDTPIRRISRGRNTVDSCQSLSGSARMFLPGRGLVHVSIAHNHQIRRKSARNGDISCGLKYRLNGGAGSCILSALQAESLGAMRPMLRRIGLEPNGRRSVMAPNRPVMAIRGQAATGWPMRLPSPIVPVS